MPGAGRGILVAVARGMTFTVVAEWLSVRVLGRWSYLPTMPTVLGIGLSPLLQSMVVPAASLLLTRWRLVAATRPWGRSPAHRVGESGTWK